MLKYPKRFTKEKKLSILSEHLEGGVSISELSRKYQVSAHSIYNWRNAMKKEQEKEWSKIVKGSGKPGSKEQSFRQVRGFFMRAY